MIFQMQVRIVDFTSGTNMRCARSLASTHKRVGKNYARKPLLLGKVKVSMIEFFYEIATIY